MGKPRKDWPYFGPFEVVIHNKPNDCWLSFLGKVFDVTPIIKEHEEETCIRPLIAMAGKDVSYWFDKSTGDIQHHIHPETGVRVPYCPHGRIPDVPVEVPATGWRPLDRPVWWQNEKYQVGLLTKRVRPLRIMNLLICKEITLNVCSEDTFYQIRERYRQFNSDIESYTWVYLDQLIKMDKTLDENGIPDDRHRLTDLGIPQNYYIPCVFIYYNDDLKYIPESDDDEEDDRLQLHKLQMQF